MECKVKVRTGSLEVEFEGSEDYLKNHLPSFLDSMVKLTNKHKLMSISEPRKDPGPDSNESGKDKTAVPDLGRYDNVFDFAGGDVKILTTPAGGRADKMVTLTMLLLLGKKMLNVEPVPFEDLRRTCEEHSCLDGPNFASTIKHAKANIIVSGKGRRLTAKLSVPGLKKAQDLAKSLDTAAN